MPFSLINALITCIKIINNVLREFLNLFYIIYLDNILIYSKIREEHIYYIAEVLKALEKT